MVVHRALRSGRAHANTVTGLQAASVYCLGGESGPEEGVVLVGAESDGAAPFLSALSSCR